VLHQIRVLEMLALKPAVPYLPKVVATGISPLILVTRRVPGVEMLTATMDHYQALTGRALSAERIMAWHVRQALGDALWRTEAGVPLPDHRSPGAWVDDIAARLRELSITIS